MHTNKADVHRPGSKMHHGNQPVLIATGIKNKPIIANAVNTVESMLHFAKILPVAQCCFIIPFQ